MHNSLLKSATIPDEAKEELTVKAVTGLTVGKMKMMLTNNVQRQAQPFTNLLKTPMFQGPGSNFPNRSLHRMGIQ
jgi:hypothetical protein